MKTTRLFCKITVVFSFLLFFNFTAADATPVPVDNASFEFSSGSTFRSDPNLGTWSLRDMAGWTHFGSRDYEWGIWAPDSAIFSDIPDGNYIGYLNGGYLSQDLDWTIAANTELTLLIDIGNRPARDFPEYRVELWAENTLLVSDGSVVPIDGGFSTLTLGYTVLDGDPNIGKTMGIRIVSDGLWLNFDNVHVYNDGVPVPEPATVLLLTSGLIGLAGFRRKLKR